jgi:hypothetical protein
MPRLPYLLTDGREKGREKDNARMTPQMSESDMIVKWPEERGLQPCLPSFAVRERVAYVRANHRTYHAASGVLHVPVNLRNCIGFELVEASITRTHYSIESPYNVVTVRVAADAEGDDVRTYALTLAVRDYTATQLKDALNSLLASTVSTTNVPGSTVYGSAHVTVTVDADTKKFKFTCTGTDSMEYCALQFSDKHLAYITGFPPASAYTGPTDSDGTDRFESRDEEAKFYPARTSALALTYALSTSAAGGLPSAGQFDLSGSRYLRLECAQLERAYSNSGVIKDLPFADDVTFATQVDPSFLRKFVDPADLGRLRINLQVLTPDAGAITYNNNGLAFYLTFAVTTLVRARERATDAFVD